ncbi:hypothetical protein K2X33_07265 [bacterium]|nr:hypothetical protein [bacterium]
MVRFFLLATGLVVVGCASGGFTKVSSNDYPARPADCPIEVLYKMPKMHHEPLGQISAVSAQSYWKGKDLASLLPDMKKAACALGADALVVTHVDEGGTAWTQPTEGKASATAIRYSEVVHFPSEREDRL